MKKKERGAGELKTLLSKLFGSGLTPWNMRLEKQPYSEIMTNAMAAAKMPAQNSGIDGMAKEEADAAEQKIIPDQLFAYS